MIPSCTNGAAFETVLEALDFYELVEIMIEASVLQRMTVVQKTACGGTTGPGKFCGIDEKKHWCRSVLDSTRIKKGFDGNIRAW